MPCCDQLIVDNAQIVETLDQETVFYSGSEVRATCLENFEFNSSNLSSQLFVCNSDGTWESESQDWSHTLQALAATSGSVYAVGSGGIILRR